MHAYVSNIMVVLIIFPVILQSVMATSHVAL